MMLLAEAPKNTGILRQRSATVSPMPTTRAPKSPVRTRPSGLAARQLFLDRAMQCRTESGQLPNFVTVDFFDIGDLFTVVDALNGV